MNETRSEIKAQNIAKLQEDLSDIDTAVKAQKKLIEDGVQTDINTILDEVAASARRPLPNWAYRPNLNMAQAQPNRFQIGLNWAWLGAANRIGCSGAVASAFFLGVD
jgi:hypothetical protein